MVDWNHNDKYDSKSLEILSIVDGCDDPYYQSRVTIISPEFCCHGDTYVPCINMTLYGTTVSAKR